MNDPEKLTLVKTSAINLIINAMRLMKNVNVSRDMLKTKMGTANVF